MPETNNQNLGVWHNSKLYPFLVQSLPAYLTDRGLLDVPKLKSDVHRSHEAIYRWFRSDQLNGPNAERLHKIANSAENVELLVENGLTPPTKEDFIPFLMNS